MPEALLARAVQDADTRVGAREPVRQVSRAVRRGVVDHQHTWSGAASSRRAHGGDDGLEILALVVRGQDHPHWAARARARGKYRLTFRAMRNAEIADALDELGDLYELDGAVVYRVVAYRQAAQLGAGFPRSVEQLVRDGRATELPNVGKTLQEKLSVAARDAARSRRR